MINSLWPRLPSRHCRHGGYGPYHPRIVLWREAVRRIVLWREAVGRIVLWMGNRHGIVLWREAVRRIVLWLEPLPPNPGRIVVVSLLLLAVSLPLEAGGQETPEASTIPGTVLHDTLSLAGAPDDLAPEKKPFPLRLTLGLGYGSRSDNCPLCETKEDNESFTGHLSLGRPLPYGFGVGMDVSVWRKSRPGTPLAPDSTGVPGETFLTNTLGNLSVSFTYDLWRIFLRAGGGMAWGSQDLEMLDGNEEIMVHTASGWGVGYSVGGGFTVPLASMVSLAFFGNYNVGFYDLVSPHGVTEREAKHRYLEAGVGLALR